jgi:hypothetical protein
LRLSHAGTEIFYQWIESIYCGKPSEASVCANRDLNAGLLRLYGMRRYFRGIEASQFGRISNK